MSLENDPLKINLIKFYYFKTNIRILKQSIIRPNPFSIPQFPQNSSKKYQEKEKLEARNKIERNLSEISVQLIYTFFEKREQQKDEEIFYFFNII